MSFTLFQSRLNQDSGVTPSRHLMFGIFALALALFCVFANRSNAADILPKLNYDNPGLIFPPIENSINANSALPGSIDAAQTAKLTPKMKLALDYVKRRYRVSPDAMTPVFEAVQIASKERKIDPLVIIAMIAIESRFNPFAESAMGAQGLMQVIPRFHLDKIPEGEDDKALLDPVVNVKVGVHVLEEAIKRKGGLVKALQYYGGSAESGSEYATRVLAEKARMEQAIKQSKATAASTVIAQNG